MATRLSAMALTLAVSAWAPKAARAQEAAPAAEPAQPAAPAQPPAPPEPVESAEAGTTKPDQERRQRELQRRLHERTDEIRREADMARAQADVVRAHSDLIKAKAFEFKPGEFALLTRSASPDTPVIITTQQLDTGATVELKEDLTVMDKLVREEAARAGAEDPQAMSIRLTVLGRQAPLYVEGAGAVFHAAVNWPLAPVGAAAGKKDDGRPRDPASKWDQAKRELSGYNAPKMRSGGMKEAALVFDQAKLDALRSALAGVLPEASNIRHLRENESVFITIQGIDDGGAPVRLTMKALKADIDAAAAGKLTPEEFAQRVAQRIG